MRNIYPKLAVPLLFAFAACATNQSDKPPVSSLAAMPEIRDTAKMTTDSGGHQQIVTMMQDTATPPKSTTRNKVASTKTITTVKTQLPDLPKPPHFENEEVNKGVQEFAGMIKENMIAEQNHDSVKMKELKTRMNSLPTNIAIWIFNMSADERKSFKDYLEKVEKVAEHKNNQQQNS